MIATFSTKVFNMKPLERRRRMGAVNRCLLEMLALLIIFLDVVVACPRSCACYVPSEVHCTFRSLTLVPFGVPRLVRRMNLGFNSISRLDKDSLVELRKLELLMMHGNNIHHIPDGVFRDLIFLQVLKLSYNKVKVITGHTLSDLTSLVRLYLDNNQIEFIHPDAFRGMTSLRLLHLEGNHLQKLHPYTFSTFFLLNHFPGSTIKHLYLSDNYLTYLPKEMLRNMPHLENLFLYGNPWTCDCRLDWLQDWMARHSGVMKCKKDKSLATDQLCPVCSSPQHLRGKQIFSNKDFRCTRPVIKNSHEKDVSQDEHLSELLSLVDFRPSFGNITLNLSDEHGNMVDLTCQVVEPRDSAEITWNYTLQISTNMTLVFDLACPTNREKYMRLWRLLGYYSEVSLHLSREIMLSKEPELSYRYRQDIERDTYYYTGVRANILSHPSWLMQPNVNIKLNRPYSTSRTVKIIFTMQMFSTTTSEQEKWQKKSWVMIKHNNATQTTFSSVVGNMIEIDCSVVSSGHPSIQWMLPDGSKVRASFSSPNNRLSVSSTGKLLIRAVDYSDAGVYYCIAEVMGDVDLLLFRLSVVESSRPPVGDEVKIAFEKYVGESVYLPCNTTASPDADLNWIFPDGSIMDTNANLSKGFIFSNGTLYIPYCRPDDNGNYKCVALNQHGEDTLSAKLTVIRQQGTQTLKRYPMGPLSASGVSTKVSAIFEDLEESSGDDAGQKKMSNRDFLSHISRPKLRSQTYPVRNLQRHFPGHRKLIKKFLNKQQRKDALGNRRKMNKSNNRIDPKRWGDILAKIREKAVPNTITEPEPHNNLEGSSPDDGSLLKKVPYAIIVSKTHNAQPVTAPSHTEYLLQQITPLKTSKKSAEVTLIPAKFTATSTPNYEINILQGNQVNTLTTSFSHKEERQQNQLENNPATPSSELKNQLGISISSADVKESYKKSDTDMAQWTTSTSTLKTKNISANFIKQRAPYASYSRKPWNSRRRFGTRGRINRIILRPSLYLITSRPQLFTAPQATETQKPFISTTLSTTLKVSTSDYSTAKSIATFQYIISNDRNGKNKINVSQLADNINTLTHKIEASEHFSSQRTKPILNVSQYGLHQAVHLKPLAVTLATSLRRANKYTSEDSWQNLQTLTTEIPMNYSIAFTSQLEAENEALAATQGGFTFRDLAQKPSQQSFTEDDAIDTSLHTSESHTEESLSSLQVLNSTHKSVKFSTAPRQTLVTDKYEETAAEDLPKKTFSEYSVKQNHTKLLSTTFHTLSDEYDSVFPIKISDPKIRERDLLLSNISNPSGVLSTTSTTPTTKAEIRITAKPQTTTKSTRSPTMAPPIKTTESALNTPRITTILGEKNSLKPSILIADNRIPVHSESLLNNHVPKQNHKKNFHYKFPTDRHPLFVHQTPLDTISSVDVTAGSVGTIKSSMSPNVFTTRRTSTSTSPTPTEKSIKQIQTGVVATNQHLGKNLPHSQLPNIPVLRARPRVNTVNLTTVTVNAETDVQFPCNSVGEPKPSMTWTKISTGAVISENSRIHRFDVQPNGTLLIHNVQLQDHGQYVCTAHNQYGIDRMIIMLIVLAQMPKILHPWEHDTSVYLGDHVNLECHAQGLPHPQISWMLPNQTLLQAVSTREQRIMLFSNGTLHLKQTSYPDSGIYKCIASNVAGDATVSIRLHVTALPPIIQQKQQENHTISDGQNMYIHCSAKGAPNPVIRWITLSGMQIRPSQFINGNLFVFPNGTLYIRNPTEKDSGTYECLALNVMGVAKRSVKVTVKRVSSTAKIIVTSPLITDVSYGGYLKLDCSASGSPEPKIIWKTPAKKLIDAHFSFDHRMKVLSNGTLSIQSVTDKDHGDYLCLARNKIGDDSVLLKVTVMMKAAIIERKQLKNHKVLYGEALKVDCVASGLPNPDIKWSFPDGTMINSIMQLDDSVVRTKRYVVFENGTLYFRDVSMKEEGDYTCYAENQIGKDEMKIHIKVVASAPFIHNNTFEVIRVLHGETASLTCRAIAQPSPTITWLSPNNHIIALPASDKYQLTTDGTLQIHKVQLLDNGNYTCLAKNMAGIDKKMVIVEVATLAPIINGLKSPITEAEEIAVKDQRVLLHCKAEGTPSPQVMWIMSENVVLPAPYYGSRFMVHHNGTLEIRSLRKSDSAQLLCIAHNEAGEARLQVQLNVTEHVEKPKLKSLATETVQFASEVSVILNCSMEGNPQPEITWFLPNGTTLVNGLSIFRFNHLPDGALIIREPSVSEAGIYRCVGRNSAGSVERKVTLQSNQKPVISSRYSSLVSITTGENLHLNCLSSGNPVPKLTWTLPSGETLTRPQRIGRYVISDNGTLTVQQASVYDRGTYHCNSENKHGSSSMSVAVIVIAYPPRITTGPSTVTYGRPGIAIKIDCMAIGIPKPEVLWEMPNKIQLKSGPQLRLYGNRYIHPQGSLVIQNPSSRDNGFYKCTTKNVVGSDSKTTYVHVF